MRLIHTDTFEFEDFGNSDPDKPYAILSHVWEEEEVNYATYKQIDKQRLLLNTPAGYSDGFSKILWGCHMARQDGIKYFWTDTCCINRSNQEDQTELDRSIRCMFKWYQNAAVCYAYLASVTESPDQVRASQHAFREKKVLDKKSNQKRWISKKWFTRGWTLQELLAPTNVHFFNFQWEYIGSKKELTKQIEVATKIRDLDTFRSASIAAKLSWAAGRETTKPEDRVYSLFGIFDVSMDIRYGEGEERAFLRLQEEIIRMSSDESIFAWKSDEIEASGLLAPWIDCFADSGDVTYHDPPIRRGPYRLTNQGMEFLAPIVIVGEGARIHPAIPVTNTIGKKEIVNFPFFAWRADGEEKPKNITIKLRRTGKSSMRDGFDFFQRIDCHWLGLSDGVKTKHKLYSVPNMFKHIYVAQQHKLKPGIDNTASRYLEAPTAEPSFSGEKDRYSKPYDPPKPQSQEEKSPSIFQQPNFQNSQRHCIPLGPGRHLTRKMSDASVSDVSDVSTLETDS